MTKELENAIKSLTENAGNPYVVVSFESDAVGVFSSIEGGASDLADFLEEVSRELRDSNCLIEDAKPTIKTASEVQIEHENKETSTKITKKPAAKKAKSAETKTASKKAKR